jgi:hypothetical protein
MGRRNNLCHLLYLLRVDISRWHDPVQTTHRAEEYSSIVHVVS